MAHVCRAAPASTTARSKATSSRSPPPTHCATTLHAPNAGAVTGLGIPRGVTLIVGGGFHGKSTLLRAIERGVYDHIPGDGRERVVTNARRQGARRGRTRVAGTDISNFIGRIPGGGDTRASS
jgi:predicted ABC-class ATPase